MRRWLCFSFFGLFVGLTAWPGQAADRALLVGVGRYQASQANLAGIDLDLTAMEEVVRLMGYSQVKVLRDEQATLGNIQQAFREQLIQGVTPDDRVLFYFSGHGSQIRDQDPKDEDDDLDEVLLPHDAGLDNNRLVRVFVDDEFGRLLGQIKARNIVVLIDACHSGTATKGLKGITLLETTQAPDLYYKFFHYPGLPPSCKGSFAVEGTAASTSQYISLSAARDDEKAVATASGSLFTRGLLHAAKQAASSGSSLTLEQARDSATDFIRNAVGNPQKAHHPFLFGNMSLAGLDIIPARTGASSQPGSSAVPGSQAPRPGAANPGLWAELAKLADAAPYPIRVSANKPRFKIGDNLVVTCQAPSAGYLNVLNIDEGENKASVLFPNQYKRDNRVEANSALNIPGPGDPFVLRAKPPARRTMIVVLHSQRPINAFTDGYGRPQDLFKDFSDKSLFEFKGMRGFDPEAKPAPGTYGAGRIMTVIE
ncbi:MAG: caspase family protein [Thermodesulfobacteriota bacterium]